MDSDDTEVAEGFNNVGDSDDSPKSEGESMSKPKDGRGDKQESKVLFSKRVRLMAVPDNSSLQSY